MKKSVGIWQMLGFVFTAVTGTLLHFLFEWTGGNRVAALFSAVNESIWEHLKLLFYPCILFAVAEYFAWGRGERSFWCIKLLGILSGLVLIPVVYYTYTGILGVNADWFNITLFFLAAGFTFYLEAKFFERERACRLPEGLALGVLLLICAAFTVFTFLPLRIPFFQDPATGTYGYR